MKNKLSRRDFLRMTAVTLSGTVLAACGPKATPTTQAPATPVPSEPAKVRWRTRPADAGEQAVYQTLSDEMDAKFANITVTYDPAPVQGYLDKALSEFSAGTAPDIIWIPGASYSAYASKNVLLDIMSYLDASSELSLDSFYPNLMDEMVHEGKLYGLPRDISTEVTYFNADLFKSKGLKTPRELGEEGSWNWDAFLKSAQALTVDEDGDGINDTWGCSIPTWWGGFWYFILANGGDFWNADRTKCALDTPEAVGGLKFNADLFHEYKVAPAPGAQIDASALFNSGKIGMLFSGRWTTPGLREQATGFTWDVAEMPEGPAAKSTFLFWGPYVIAETTEDPNATWTILEQLCGVEAQSRVAELGTNIPSRDSDEARAAFLASKPPENNQAFLDGIPYATVEPAPWTVNMDELMWAHLDPAVQRVFAQEITAEEFGNTICEELDPLFEAGL
jgi:multiple sugar transport system substrate-binding protein